ncbi:MAG: hypothetical protein A3G87_05505 [Omnitrophica bacterium RIFCSPLOWO2_12_FULL_50_11]|nr:MAG: hypothetical protein A3G87_05505 [Omnitrophica bacterium RIFCSPLOWO2_12_FULL_50_11]
MSEAALAKIKVSFWASPSMQRMMDIANRIASTDLPVLIEGEPGTGKEWLARAIHFASSRAHQEFVVVDCSSFSEVFLESELFGYVRGSFVGAIRAKKGLLELASGGTIFLKDVSKMKLTLQGKFERVLEEQRFWKIGGVALIDTNVRVIASTDQDLKALVNQKKFRPALYYQLSTVRLGIPPLRQRREDIEVLTDYFLGEIAKRKGSKKKVLGEKTKPMLLLYNWPGNIQELESEIAKSLVLTESGDTIEPDHLSPHIRKKRQALSTSSGEVSLKTRKQSMISSLEKNAIEEALKKTSGNRTRAARLLSISRQHLIRKIANYQIRL